MAPVGKVDTFFDFAHARHFLMKRTILLYGTALAILVALMKWLEYRLFVRQLSIEFYVGIVALFFTGLGVWAGMRLTNQKKIVIQRGSAFRFNEAEFARLEITKRELDVLEQMAAGLSNQEIANKLFVSTNTVKTHTSNLFQKLDARNRTQAVQKARELSLIP